MTQEKLQSHDVMPTAAALDFVKRRTATSSTTKPTRPADSHEEQTRSVHGTTIRQSKQAERVYVPFTTRIRRDLKQQLKRLSHYREESGHGQYSLQQFVELAITDWLEKQDEIPTWST